MDDDKLIELVQQSSVLYDLSHPRYMDRGYKHEVWDTIGTELKAASAVCKARWNNIRDNYRKSLKRNKMTKKVRLYKFTDQLIFLNQHFDKEFLDNIECPNSAENNNSDDPGQQYEADDEEIHWYNNYYEDPDVKDHNLTLDPLREQPPKQFLTKSGSQESQTSKKIDSVPLMKYHNTKQDSENTDISPIPHLLHPVDAFLSGIAPTLKSLSSYQLHFAKSEIFAIVQKYELQMLTEHHPLTETSSIE